jgi:GAF domain-containing protein
VIIGNGQPAPQPAPQRAADALSGELLRSVVDVARSIFGAAASSVFLFDEDADELVFQAVAGRGEDHLVGTAFPAARGIAGWVAKSGEPLVVNDLAASPTFDRDFAQSTAFIPTSLMAAPLIYAGRVLGVLEVLDPAPQSRSSLNDLDLLALFAGLAAIALRVVTDRALRAAQPDLGESGRAAARQLMDGLRHLLEAGDQNWS